MSRNRSAVAAILWAALAGSVAARTGEGSCAAASGAGKAALVELYTSEACSSCPPADRILGRLPDYLEPGAAAYPLALHVDYWDGPGWTDLFAQKIFAQRQNRLVRLNHHSTVYTPHFFVDGKEVSHAPKDSLREAVHQVNAEQPQAQIRFTANATKGDRLSLTLDAQTVGNLPGADLYVVLAQNGLASRVSGGENSGAFLEHEHVARSWIGPIALADGRIHLDRVIALPPGAAIAPLDLVAFVEDRESGAILQTVGAANCTKAGN